MATTTHLNSVTQGFLRDPLPDGTITVADASRFEVGALCFVSSTGQPTKAGLVSAVTANTVKLSTTNGLAALDVGAYRAADAGSIQQVAQDLTAGANSSTDPVLVSTVATGLTINSNAAPTRVTWKATLDKTAFVAAALTADISLCTVPAKAKVVSVICDTTVAWAGLAGTIALIVGKTAGGNQYILSHDVKSGVVTKGLVDGDMGASLAAATAAQGGDMPSWSAGTILKLRMTSGTGNIGDGTTTNLSAGGTTVYVTVELNP